MPYAITAALRILGLGSIWMCGGLDPSKGAGVMLIWVAVIDLLDYRKIVAGK